MYNGQGSEQPDSNREPAPLVKLNAAELSSPTEFLIDSGAEINLIHVRALQPRTVIARHDFMNLIGITTNTLATAGSTEITFFDKPIKFQVFTNDLPLPVPGILGVIFLKNELAQISFHHNALITDSRPITPVRFINYEYRKPKATNYILRVRMRTTISIELKNTDLKSGYLPRIEAPENGFIGNAAVTNRNGHCDVMAINATENDVEIEIPP